MTPLCCVAAVQEEDSLGPRGGADAVGDDDERAVAGGEGPLSAASDASGR